MATLDMAGIITRVCAKLKTKFSKVSIGQIGSGTVRVAEITIDGIRYDLWAPTPPSASAVLPQMDGVASAGSSAGAASGYSRGNHVHPTDTSRQAKITASGLLKGDGNGGVSAAVPGTDYALLPSVTSADNGKMLMVVNGAWAAEELPVYNGEIAEPDYTVDISLTSPGMPADFNSCTIKAYDDTQGAGVQLATISSPTGSASVVVSGAGKIIIELRGEDVFVNEEHISCTGGVTYDSKTPHDEGPDVIFQITGNGTIILSGILW